MEKDATASRGSTSLKPLIVFALLAFGPAYLGFGFLCWQMLKGGSAGGLVQLAFLMVLTLPVVWGAYRLIQRSGSAGSTFWVLWLAWQFFGLEIGYVFAAALSGVSMAVVDGAVTWTNLLGQQLFFAGMMLLPLQVFIVPWAVWSRRMLRLFLPDLFAVPTSQSQVHVG